jgi:hypothetical protein
MNFSHDSASNVAVNSAISSVGLISLDSVRMKNSSYGLVCVICVVVTDIYTVSVG